jgi:hypothetical protein
MGADVGARHWIDRLVAALVDPPALQRNDVRLVEFPEALFGERLGRAQLARGERRKRAAERAEILLDRGKPIGQRQRLDEAHALDLEARLRRHAAGVLEHRRDVAIPAWRKQVDCAHHITTSMR